jgi:5'-methylthioadenosine phosphorylase
VQQVIETIHRNVVAARAVVRRAAEEGARLSERTCSCGTALRNAVMTAPSAIPAAAQERVRLLLGDRT